MRLLAHQIVADVRRHRVLLSLWLIVLVASTVVQGVRPSLAALPAAANTVVLLDGLLMIVRILLRVSLIALVIQTHPLVGSDAFWLTRPIARLMMLRAKAIVLLVFMVLAPVAAEAVLMATSGVPPGQIVRVAIESALFATMWAALLATAAALTPTFARFVLLCGAVLGTLALYIAIQITISSIAPGSTPQIAEPPPPEDSTGAIVLVVALILGCVVTLVAQYRSRRLLQSSVIAVVMVLAMSFAPDLWRWPLLRSNVDLPAWPATEGAQPIGFRPDEVHVIEQTEERPVRTIWRRSIAPVRIASLEPGWSADIALLEATLQIDGTGTFGSLASPYPQPMMTADAKSSRDEAIRVLIGATTVEMSSPPPPNESQRGAALLILSDSDFTRLAPVKGHYHGRFYVQFTRHQIEATLPLRAGADVRSGNYRLGLDSVLVSSGRMDLGLRESDATSSFDRVPTGQRTYYVRNRRTGMAIEARRDEFDFSLLPRMFGGFSASSITWGFWAAGLTLRLPPPWASQQFDGLDETWLRDADLLVVKSTREGIVQRTLDVEGFPLDRID